MLNNIISCGWSGGEETRIRTSSTYATGKGPMGCRWSGGIMVETCRCDRNAMQVFVVFWTNPTYFCSAYRGWMCSIRSPQTRSDLAGTGMWFICTHFGATVVLYKAIFRAGVSSIMVGVVAPYSTEISRDQTFFFTDQFCTTAKKCRRTAVIPN